MFKKILIRFGELSLKGKNKMSFVHRLAHNIKLICELDTKDMVVQIDRIFIPFSDDNINKLQYVFGISSYSPVIEIPTNIDLIKKTLLSIDLKQYKSFKINSRRKWKEFSFNSLELNNILGQFILDNNHSIIVDVKNPDIEIAIEVHENFSYIFWEKIDGLHGLPVGTSGKTLHLLSGGIDSPVAALEMMKRGVNVDFISFISPPHTDELTVEKINKIVNLLTKYQIKSKLYLFNYTDLMNYIGLTSEQNYKIILMRRSFYRIASSIALESNCLGISNGENLAQVASQTMEAINTIHSQAKLPVYQPLITKDKLETIAISQKYKLFEISIIKACETCELFAPNHPITKPSKEKAEKLELELEMLSQLEKIGKESKIEIKYFSITKNKYE